jgi:hypothetical protein
VAAEARSRGDERPEDQEDDEDHDRVGHAAILVAVPDRSERDDGKAHDLEHDDRERLPEQAAGAPVARGVELRERVGEHRHGSEDPAGRLREEVVRDADDGLVLDPDRPDCRGLRRQDQDHAGPDEEAGQGDDEGRDASLGDHERLEEADRRRDEKGGEDRQPPGPTGIIRPQEQRHHDPADGADEGHGEIDLADQEHEDHPDRDRRDRRHLQQEVREVSLGEERVVE